jgi:hypothetical protein
MHGPDNFQPVHILLVRVSLPAYFYFAVAIAAIDRSALTGLEGYGSSLAAIGTYSRVHLPRGGVTGVPASKAVAAVAEAFCFPCLTAVGAALGLIGVASGLELLLFLNTKGKGIIAIGAS